MLFSSLFLVETVSDDGILGKLTDIFNLLKDFFSDVGSLGATLGKFILDLPKYFSWLPVEIVAIVILAFSVLIVLRVSGRSS